MNVTSLYTNLPLEEAITIICKAYAHSIETNLQYLANTSQICSDLFWRRTLSNLLEKNYLQVQGTAMGAQMALAFANIFISAIETEIINTSPHNPLVWKGFIDNIFSLWNIDKDDTYSFNQLANNHHPTIKFTAEVSDTETVFLDTSTYKGERCKMESFLDLLGFAASYCWCCNYTTPKELKTECDCSHRQLFRPLWGSSVWHNNQTSGSDEKISAHSILALTENSQHPQNHVITRVFCRGRVQVSSWCLAEKIKSWPKIFLSQKFCKKYINRPESHFSF